MIDLSRSDHTAGVAGAGTMGRGIAQVLAQCGVRTVLYDAQPGAAQRGLDSIAQACARLAEKGRIKDPQAVTRRIEVVPGLGAL
ncbi:MAG TPA: 3-hydroxyacyl-CoA dehydrogenase NAD-binding domain-containing protein, partial [Burkholderiales bacterium]|nr:3-hydroxyacyl-CoA dehydrogenase NAD-binding domain-containing protein [Burkholderiales bacterium]